MKTGVLLVFFAFGFGTAIAEDPPGYPRALIGHVTRIVAEGLIVETVSQDQIHLVPFPPGVDHECFVGSGTVLLRGVRSKYHVGDRIEITVAEGQGNYLFAADPTRPVQLKIWDLLNESLAFPVDVDWDPANPASNSASTAPAPAAPAPSPPNSTSSDFNPGSINDDPLPPSHRQAD